MKTIFRVAKTELRTLFYSPIAWFLLVVFMVQCGVVYTGILEGIAKVQELSGTRSRFLTAVTAKVFLNNGGMFGTVMQNLYLYIPLLTMGLISRETGSGTIKLLYSSPVKIREIVFGKFLAMVIYSLLLVAIVGIFVVSGLLQIESPDVGMLMSALLGFFLLLCTYASIGLFMSSLTTYQVVAAVCTFVMIGVLSYIGSLWQDIEFVRGLTYFLSINGRTYKMLGGLITTKDLLYFILIVYIFLGLTIYKLKAGMESKPFAVKMSRYAAVVASALLIGYVSSIPRFVGYYDATANKSRTLTPQVQKIIAELGGAPLEITAYNNLLGRYWNLGSPKSYNENLARWEPYMRFKDDIELKTVLYYDSALDNSLRMLSSKGKTLQEDAVNYAKTMDVDLSKIKTPEEIRKIIDLRPELNRYVMQLKWKDRTTFLRVFNDQQMWPGETEVAAALKRLLQAKLPKIAFLTGDLERDVHKKGDKDYQTLTNLSTFRAALINQGFDVDTLSLETQDIPADVATLVLADPKIELTPVTMEKLQQYIARGGNMLITTEPNRQSIINPLLKQLGVQLMDGMIVQASKDYSPDLVAPVLTKAAGSFSKTLSRNAADSMKVSMPGVAAFSFLPDNPFQVQPLLLTDSVATWNKMKKLDLSVVTSASAGKPMPVTDDQADSNVGKPVMVTDNKATTGKPMRVTTTNVSKPVQVADDQVTADKPVTTSKPGLIRMETVQMSPARSDDKPVAAGDSVPRVATVSGERKMLMRRDTVPGQRSTGAMKITRMEIKPREGAAPRKKMPVKAGQSSDVDVASAASTTSGVSARSRAAALGTVTYAPGEGDTKAAFPTAVSLTRQIGGKEQRIVVTGDADFMSNSELQRGNMRTANFAFNTGIFSWLSYGEFPIDTSRPPGKDNSLKLTMGQVDFLKIIYNWVMPGVLLLFGAVLLIRRKRK